MPMSGSAMGDAVYTAIQAAKPSPGTNMTAAQEKAIWVAACTAIVAHITANAQVAAGIAVATTGSASAQTGATTAPGLIT